MPAAHLCDLCAQSVGDDVKGAAQDAKDTVKGVAVRCDARRASRSKITCCPATIAATSSEALSSCAASPAATSPRVLGQG